MAKSSLLMTLAEHRQDKTERSEAVAILTGASRLSTSAYPDDVSTRPLRLEYFKPLKLEVLIVDFNFLRALRSVRC